jgi:hypothetical protein
MVPARPPRIELEHSAWPQVPLTPQACTWHLPSSEARSPASALSLTCAVPAPLLSCRNTPGALFTLATVLLAAGPALVYFTPDDSTALVALQAIGALVCVAGGAAAYGGASLLSSLQK